ncbi:MAG: 50S ribosomal protein L10 [Deltaproteobacteria bacterium]|nr:50S ribosomal protein L10 [Deltaproteobacteria bacterium]
MNKETKAQIVSHLASKFKEATFAVLTDYRGLKVEELSQLRNELRNVSTDYRVAKNSLLKRASTETAFEQLHQYLVGPTAIMLGYDDPIVPSKVLVKFLGNYSKLNIKAGLLQDKILSAEEIKALSLLPGRKELLAKIVSLCTQPQMRLLNALNYLPLKLVQVLSAIEKSKLDKNN